MKIFRSNNLYKFLACALSCAGSQALLFGADSHEDNPLLMDNMVVTGTRTLQRVSDVPVRTEVVTERELAMIQPRTLADAVEFVPGLRVENNCQNCNFSQIRLLGLEGAYSQILVESQPLVSSLAAVYAIEQMPSTMVERIEVVKGGGSALYGPGAIGGVVNIIPRTPSSSGLSTRFTLTDMKGTNVSGKSPNFGFSAGLQADVVAGDGATALTVYGQGDRELPLDLTGDGFTEIGLKELSSGGVRLVQKVSSVDAKFSLDTGATFENRRGGNNIDLPEPEADIAESIQSKRYSLSGAWEQSLGETMDYRASVSYVSMKRDSYYGSGRDPNAFGNTDNPLLVLDSQLNHHLGDHLLSWGIQHNREKLKDVQPAYSRQTDATYRNTGLYVEDDWKLSSSVALVGGLRGDDNSQLDDVAVSPRAALRWTPVQSLTTRFGYSTGFRAPQVFDEDLHVTQVGGTGQIVKNAPGLTEEKGRNLTLGIQWQKELSGLTWMLETNFFHTRLQDSFVLEEDASLSTDKETILIRRNGDGSKVYGGEFNVGLGRGDAWTLQLGYVEQRSLYDSPISPLEGTSTRRIQRTPNGYGTATLDAALPFYSLRLFVGAKYTGPMEVPHAAPAPEDIPAGYAYSYIAENVIAKSPSFLTWDLNLSREFELGRSFFGESHRHLLLRVGVKNLTDDRQKDFDQGEFRDSAYVYGPRFPRSFFASVEVNF